MTLFSVTFLPHGPAMFFDVPLRELYDQNVPLKLLLKGRETELEDKLYETPLFEERVRLVENFLSVLLKKSFKEYELNRIAKSIEMINRSKGLISVSELASSACLSPKQYERTFMTLVGSSPKQFLRTIRFQNTLHLKHLLNGISLSASG